MREGLTFDDVLLIPKFSDVKTRKDVSTRTKLTKNIFINLPIISANMDTVTESAMAINMAEAGGIGIIHRFLTIEKQVEEVVKAKRTHNFIIYEPYTIHYNATLEEVKNQIELRGGVGFLVVDDEKKLIGMITSRDLMFEEDDSVLVKEIMTPFEKLIVKKIKSRSQIDLEEVKKLLKTHKIEKLPLVDENNLIKGLITVKDIEKRLKFPLATKDDKGRLMVGAAIGVKNDYLERARELVSVGVDVLVIDIAHGHSRSVLDTLYKIKSAFPQIDIIAGNVATKDGTLDLIKAGADAVKCGIGGGSTCVTRLVAGAGIPQLTAVMDCYEAAKDYNVPIISDGGIRYSGDIVKALSAGASSVMLGSLLAGCEETPGLNRVKNGQKVKIYRGMASFDAALHRKLSEKGYEVELNDYVPEGIETIMPYKGPVKEIINQLSGGLKSGMSYLGVHKVEDIIKNVEFIKITHAGWEESTPHAEKI